MTAELKALIDAQPKQVEFTIADDLLAELGEERRADLACKIMAALPDGRWRVEIARSPFLVLRDEAEYARKGIWTLYFMPGLESKSSADGGWLVTVRGEPGASL